MASDTGSSNVLLSIERHIQSLNPFQPKKAIVYIGKYATSKLVFNGRTVSNYELPVLLEKIAYNDDQTINQTSSLTPLKFGSHKINTSVWYGCLSRLTENPSIISDLGNQIGKPPVIITVASVWDGYGSAILPSLNAYYTSQNSTSLSLILLPSNQHEPNDYFNAYAAIKLYEKNDQTPVLLLDQDFVESYQGLNQTGGQLTNQGIVNYMLGFLCGRESLVQDFVAFSIERGFFFFTPTILTGASYQIYGSIENIFKMALLKPLSELNISSSSSVYAVLRMPVTLKDKLLKKTIEFALNQLFEGKVPAQQIQVADTIYTKDAGDRIDALVLIGTRNVQGYFIENQRNIDELKNKAVENGLITEDWQLVEPTVSPRD
jgi:hypothetical protein